jgi:hypothetical protein
MTTSAKQRVARTGWWAEYLPLWDEPMSEGLQGAACGPACKAIATCAARAWERGWTAEDWRSDLLSRHHEEDDLLLIAQAEDCMHGSGLWLWNS